MFTLVIRCKMSNYSAYLLLCQIAVLKALIYSCKLRAFALLLYKTEGNLSRYDYAYVVSKISQILYHHRLSGQ